ncbi:MAG TPA: hypothetical protein VMU89_15575 [Thermomicrobiaceae bacterium]|nr:hypothetical protein [Thermomicrobiaceae bacterium]
MSRSDDWLRVRRDERQALLDRAVEMLAADRRVAAAWLVGSLGRDAADDLSALDLWVVVEDDHMAAIAADRRAFAARIGRPVLVQEAPRNAPPGGAYLLVLYHGEAGSQQVAGTGSRGPAPASQSGHGCCSTASAFPRPSPPRRLPTRPCAAPPSSS